MKNVLNIVKKELDKIFKSPRLIFSTFLLSPLLLFVIYSTMGDVMTKEMEKTMLEPSNIGIINVSESNNEHSFYQAIKTYNQLQNNDTYSLELININLTFYENNVTIEELNDENSDVRKEINQTIQNESIDLWLFYEQTFDQDLNELVQDVKNNNENKKYPLVRYFINSYYSANQNAIQKVQTIIELQKNIFFQNLNINPNIIDFNLQQDLITEKQQANESLQQIAMLVPMLIVIFIFAGGMGIGADLIAGEKERGTISTLLMTPTTKNQIVFGKIISGIILTSIAALCSAIGMLLSVGKLMGVSGGIKLSFVQIVSLIIVVVLLALLAISLFLAASTFASNIKEATMYITPIYIVSMIISILPMFSISIPSGFIPYIIPIYNVTLAIKGILIGELLGTQFILIIVSTLIYFILILFLVTKLFKSERVMFAK